jgi:hypothetical protein
MQSRGTLIFALVFLLIAGSGQAFARRRGDLPSSTNGPGTATDCPTTSATPFLAALDGHSTSSSCTDSGGHPYTYPNLVSTFTGNGYSIVITPVLWMNGGVSTTAKTILQLEVTRPVGSSATVVVNSLVLNQILANPNYVACDLPSASNQDTGEGIANGADFGYCMTYRQMAIPALVSASDTYTGNSLTIQEPDPIALSDNTMTRWDFVQFTQTEVFDLVVDGFPNNPGVTTIIDAFGYDPSGMYNTLNLSPPYVAITTTVNGRTAATLGSLALSIAPGVTDDLFVNPVPVTAGAFTDFKNTAATYPQQGNAATNQGDPVPPCFDGDQNTTDKTAIYRSVWYSMVPQASGSVSVSTDGSHYDTRVYVFTGSESSPVEVACNDDSATVVGPQSDTGAFSVTAASSYRIMVSEAPEPVGTLLDSNGDPILDEFSDPVNGLVPAAVDASLHLAVTGSGLTPTPTSESFGNQALSQTSSTRTLSLKASNANLSSIAPTVSGDFALAGGTCASTLTSGSSCSLNVTFTPTALGTRSGTLTVASSGILGPLQVPLVGVGAHALTTSISSMSFGTVYVGANAALSATLSNNTNGSLVLTAAIAPAGTDFSVGSGTCGSSLAAHTSCTFQIVFMPTGTKNETANFTYTSGTNSAVVSLRGSGLVPLAFSPPSITFGSVPVHTSIAMAQQLTNNTAASLTLTRGISPSGTAFFVSSGTCGTVLAAHAACTLSVLFAPTSTGAQSATLAASGGGYTASATLTGTGK